MPVTARNATTQNLILKRRAGIKIFILCFAALHIRSPKRNAAAGSFNCGSR
jgi:hypothetical protein